MSQISAITPQKLTVELVNTLQTASPVPDNIRDHIASFHISTGLSSYINFLSLGQFYIDVDLGEFLSFFFMDLPSLILN